jgi:cytochrome c biogenesis factor
MVAPGGKRASWGVIGSMSANSVKPADGRFLYGILVLLIGAALVSVTVAAVAIAKSEPGDPSIVSKR